MDTVSISTDGPTKASGAGKALVKGLALIDAVCAAGAPLRAPELVEASGLPRVTALRLLDVLIEERALQLTADGAYALGPRLAAWGQRYLEGLDVRAAAEDLMAGLAQATRETCFLGIREERSVLYVAKADSPQAVRPAAQIGTRNPLHCTGLGKAMLAHLGEDVLGEYCAHGLPGKTPNTITDANRLAEEMRITRERGYAIDDVENEDGVRCVAAPIRDHTGAVVAGVSVSAPAYRFALEDLPELGPRVQAAAAEVSSRIGYRQGGGDG